MKFILAIAMTAFTVAPVAFAGDDCGAIQAEVFTVTSLAECGTQLPNSGVRGVINRHRACAQETIVARVFAPLCSCNDCATQTRVAQIRCERGQPCTCATPGYAEALVQDLTSPSRKVRRAAKISLRMCGLRVSSERACVEAPVPSILWN